MQELQSLDDIFTKKIFRIPDYQRGYAWGEKQLIDFWEDLLNLSDERLHYTGVLSIKSVPNESVQQWGDENWLIEKRKFQPYYIVDGQQRLTTVSILLQCLVELVEELNNETDHSIEDIYLGSYPLKEIKEKYIVVSMPPLHLVKTYKFGYESDNPSFTFLRHKIFNEPHSGSINETFYTLNLENAKKFFSSNLKSFVQTNGKNKLEDLYDKLTQKFMFNLYEIDDNFDVFVAFETMNNRGKKLSDLELLKNRLIYLTTLYSNDEVVEEDKNATRDAINNAWGEVYYQLGRNKNHPLSDDDFLKAHWIMYFKYSRNKGNDYIHYLLNEQFNPKKVLEKTEIQLDEMSKIEEQFEIINDDDDDDNIESEAILKSKLSIMEINEYVNSLIDASKEWYNTHFPENNDELTSEEQIAMDRLNRIGIGYFRPLVMSCFLKTDSNSKDRINFLKEVEKFIFTGFRLSRTPSSTGSSAYYRAARELYKDEKSIDEIIGHLVNGLSWLYDENGVFKYNYFKDFISKKFDSSGDGFYAWNDLKYLLYEYEEDLKETRNQPKISWKNFVKGEKDKLSIEHIYPQTATKDSWKKHFDQYDDEQRKYLNGTLGNLLPLSSSINSSLQNDGFEDKKSTKKNDKGDIVRNGYSNGSYSELEVASKDEWTAVEIKERGLKLLSFMEKRWNISLGSIENKLDLLYLSFLDTPKSEVEAAE